MKTELIVEKQRSISCLTCLMATTNVDVLKLNNNNYCLVVNDTVSLQS